MLEDCTVKGSWCIMFMDWHTHSCRCEIVWPFRLLFSVPFWKHPGSAETACTKASFAIAASGEKIIWKSTVRSIFEASWSLRCKWSAKESLFAWSCSKRVWLEASVPADLSQRVVLFISWWKNPVKIGHAHFLICNILTLKNSDHILVLKQFLSFRLFSDWGFTSDYTEVIWFGHCWSLRPFWQVWNQKCGGHWEKVCSVTVQTELFSHSSQQNICF